MAEDKMYSRGRWGKWKVPQFLLRARVFALSGGKSIAPANGKDFVFRRSLVTIIIQNHRPFHWFSPILAMQIPQLYNLITSACDIMRFRLSPLAVHSGKVPKSCFRFSLLRDVKYVLLSLSLKSTLIDCDTDPGLQKGIHSSPYPDLYVTREHQLRNCNSWTQWCVAPPTYSYPPLIGPVGCLLDISEGLHQCSHQIPLWSYHLATHLNVVRFPSSVPRRWCCWIIYLPMRHDRTPCVGA